MMKKIIIFVLLLQPLFVLAEAPKARQPSASSELKQAFRQVPKEGDFYYAIGGAASIPPGLEYRQFSPLGQSPAGTLSCGLFKPEDAFDQAMGKSRVLFDRALATKDIFKNSALYQLGATDPRLFNLITLAIELARDEINQKRDQCESIRQEASANSSNLVAVSQAHQLLALQNANKNIITAVDSVLPIAREPLRFPCPHDPKQLCSGAMIAPTLQYTYEELTKDMQPDNIYSREFKSAAEAAQKVRDLIGDTPNIPPKGIDYLYHKEAQENFARLNQAVLKTKESLKKGEGASLEIMRDAVGDQTSGPLVTADLLERLARDWKHSDEVITRIAFDKAFLQVNRQVRLVMNLLNAALVLPSLQMNSVARQFIQEGQAKLKTDLEFINLEAQAADKMSRYLRTIVQKSEADDLRSARQPTIKPKSNVCFIDGAFVEC